MRCALLLALVVAALPACRSNPSYGVGDLAAADLSSSNEDLAGRDLAGRDLAKPTGDGDMARVCGPTCSTCPEGPCCGNGCCKSGEWCDKGTCRCGQGDACGDALICATGGPVIGPGDNPCGITCCGDIAHPCPL